MERTTHAFCKPVQVMTKNLNGTGQWGRHNHTVRNKAFWKGSLACLVTREPFFSSLWNPLWETWRVWKFPDWSILPDKNPLELDRVLLSERFLVWILTLSSALSHPMRYNAAQCCLCHAMPCHVCSLQGQLPAALGFFAVAGKQWKLTRLTLTATANETALQTKES